MLFCNIMAKALAMVFTGSGEGIFLLLELSWGLGKLQIAEKKT